MTSVPLTVVEARAMMEKLYRRIEHRRPDVVKNEAYYDGDHSLKYATEQWNKSHGDRYKGFADNWTAVVADAPSDRTAVVGFQLPDEDGFSRTEREQWNCWLENDMEAQQMQGFLTTRIATRSFVMVWGDADDEPVITWEHPNFVEIEYDDENPRFRVAAARAWRTDTHEFGTLYTPDVVWKFWRKLHREDGTGRPKSEVDNLRPTAGTWELRELPGTEVNPAANPMGRVPIVEVRNRPRLRAEPVSDIAGVAAMQDAINLFWAYLFVAADHASLPARIIQGHARPEMPVLDKDGQVIGSKPIKISDLGADRLLFLEGDGTTSQWDAAKLDVFTNVIGVCTSHVASQTRTPSHYIVRPTGMSNVNAEALKMDEIGLAQKVREMHLHATPSMREVFALMALVKGNKALAASCRRGKVNWSDPFIHSDSQLADAFQKDIASGFPFEFVAQRRYNLGPAELAELMAMRAREQRAAIAMGVNEYLDNGDEDPADENQAGDPDQPEGMEQGQP